MSDEERSDLKACAAVGVPLLFDYCTPFRTQVAVSLTVRIYRSGDNIGVISIGSFDSRISDYTLIIDQCVM